MNAFFIKHLALPVALLLLAWFAAQALVNKGIEQCEQDAERGAKTILEAQITDHQKDIDRGEKISKQLLEAQRKLYAVNREYLVYANSIVGNCPNDLGLLIHYAASGESVPPTASTPIADAATPHPVASGIPASVIGQNTVENYTRCNAAIKQLEALIEYEKGRIAQCQSR